MKKRFRWLFGSDQDLIIALQDSAPTDKIWSYAVRKYEHIAIGSIYSKINRNASREEAETAYMDAWVMVCRQIRQKELDFSRKKAKLSTYLTEITIRKYQEIQKKKERQRKMGVLLADVPDFLDEEPFSDLFKVLPEVCRQLLHEAIRSITLSHCASLFHLRYWENLGWKEIGQKLNVSPEHLQNQCTHCKKDLRKRLAAARFHEDCFNIL